MDVLYILKKIIFEPRGIIKLMATGLFASIPVIGPIYLLGWTCEVYRRAEEGYSTVLPDFLPVDFIREGLGLAICFLIYNLPVLVLFGLKELIRRLTEKFLPNALGSGISSIVGGISTVLGTILLLVFLFLVPMIIRLYLEHYDIRGAMDFGRIYRFSREHFRDLLSPLALLCVVLIFAAAGASIIFIGIFITLPLASAFYVFMLSRMDIFTSL